jgi:hypothetical protein
MPTSFNKGKIYHTVYLFLTAKSDRGPTACSPQSSGLNPLDFHSWRRLKSLVYAAPVNNEEAFNLAPWMPVRLSAITSIFERMGQSMLRRVRDILSTYCKCILSTITQKLNVSGRMLTWTIFLV